LTPGLVAADHGWWYPEVEAPGLGWDDSNINILTDNDPDGYDTALGATDLRFLLCKICPVDSSLV